MTDQDITQLQQIITSYERKVWDALVAGDKAADAALLSAQFFGVYPDGFAGKQDHCGQLDHGPTVHSYHIQDARLLPLGPDHALFSYRASFRRSATANQDVMYVSSVWQRDGQEWINIFSQDTPQIERPAG
ncbi:nuclear transport factor 2 family protein [Sulfitobacter geojensis]|uniref:Nuclear transport factor 2 family protein n=1 Tax=Sulfitobacter geojensis TaxID=1342299 RepID=A0AAE3B722_9RHOB|nr:nuclear transport factor 2 family protein [Sulfitobacter geojensis]MBM1690482.1 nuclear transport factor 2 family protein [Sulfitobacter geojensis]MBM1694548.1 nuclear transport factor 2 family protein [Sulfitobacter geojensis]MBM1706714.1 nuclear transport factor 2 family protein [Sulfitobacter geojensis]MBM1710772.1 nuclear transport factor 2 family protein [Sulfitobacter geojensis]MBM1714838.1 nuclear transport factor 2 family protein [Sulfitobacter geojensis]